MVRFEAWLFKLFLGLMWALPFWMSPVTSNLCTSLTTLKDGLNATLRRRFLKYNFPINYTIQVRYEEVFRLRNISRLNDTVDVRDLQDVWVKVTKTGIKKILAVLPEKHPTRHKYLKNLDELFSSFLQIYLKQNSGERDIPDVIEDIFERLEDPYYQGWRSVTPKSLLDNCYRTMHCLFKDCFLINGDEDYCKSQHWRKGKGTQG
ncbi:interleukin-34 [Tachysurus vachellii]|nr:interleukin-34 [Tachysurus vachellii]XP_060733958.1 interleukin-34 [Tachysurus vachellii]